MEGEIRCGVVDVHVSRELGGGTKGGEREIALDTTHFTDEHTRHTLASYQNITSFALSSDCGSAPRLPTISSSYATPPGEQKRDQVLQPMSILLTFMQAASSGNVGLVEFTLGVGADVWMVADDGSTALHWAVKTGQIEMIQYLLHVGASANTKNLKGRTPLLEAVHNHDHQVFTVLLQNGALF